MGGGGGGQVDAEEVRRVGAEEANDLTRGFGDRWVRGGRERLVSEGWETSGRGKDEEEKDKTYDGNEGPVGKREEIRGREGVKILT